MARLSAVLAASNRVLPPGASKRPSCGPFGPTGEEPAGSLGDAQPGAALARLVPDGRSLLFLREPPPRPYYPGSEYEVGNLYRLDFCLDRLRALRRQVGG